MTGKKSKHYTMQLNMDFKLSDLQKWALIEPTRALLDLPDPETAKEDILYETNAAIDIESTGNADAPESVNIRSLRKKRLPRMPHKERSR